MTIDSWCKAILMGFLLSIIGLNPSYANEATEVNHFRVGVLANHGVLQAKQRWQPMMDYLSEQVPNSHFEVVPVDFNGMRSQLLEHDLQFIVTNPGQYLHLSNNFPLSWLATMKSRKHQGSTFTIGATIIVRADSPIRTLQDLRGRNVVASDPQALGGYQAAMGLLHKMGFLPEQFFGQVRFLGFPLEPLIYQVRDGSADAAIAPFCTLEEMIATGLVNQGDYRVIHPATPAGYDCEVSTQLYPNWSFAAADTVSPKLTMAITRALFDLPADHIAAITADTLGWTAPVSQLKVIELFKELQLQGASPPLYQTVYKWMAKNKEWGGALLFIFIISTIYHLWLEYKFRQKSEFLVSTERQLKDKALQLERLQSAAILGEIGAGLAHELNQPIAAITQYSEGAMLQLERLGQDNPELYDVLGKINAQSIRAGTVVHRIRGLLKRRQAKTEPLDIVPVVKEALALLRRELDRANVQVNVRVQGEPFELMGDSVGLSQMWVNLVKNSLDALETCGDNRVRQLWIDIYYHPNEIKVLVIDNGEGLQGQASELMASFASTKDAGLGLGLAICKDVVTRHHGSIQIENCQQSTQALLPWQQGCVVTVVLPKE
ncbi:PhnD/SsuA/transferrin family substrate-binding protein [Shewanella sp. M16]|uniref:sensor histidine kinase n=1 Tax=Shewanella sp. M16 TaxID=2830837 RepID=UPI001BAFFF5A|nr:PhnD/SsuA/transferrin family substrate-binding protein [Shewanella sp. M16]MBS0042973.1 PhnD/SsuA/transferrin family substrate-binding protein [Shewanella sp. M16]